MEPDKRIVLWTVIQFSHTKAFRDKWRINGPSLSILCALYYSEYYMEPPKRGGVKNRLYEMNPQMNYYKFTEWLNRLETVGLVAFTTPNKLQATSYKLTKAGKEAIESLYSIQAIGEGLTKY